MPKDFEEISHSGGTITFRIETDESGQQRYQTTMKSSRPVPTVMVGLYALPPGVPVAPVNIAGMGGSGPQTVPIPGCLLVLVASDSGGKFGHLCPNCEGYWRSGPWPTVCPYCAFTTSALDFLSASQRRYIEHYCTVLHDALSNLTDGEAVIDMDAVADATANPDDRPAFYVSEEGQQHRFVCTECEGFNDIIGKFGYCADCRTRNDLNLYETATGPAIRDRLNRGDRPEGCIRDAVASADTFIAQYAKQLADLVPMTKARAAELSKSRFHDLGKTVALFEGWFDIRLARGVSASDLEFAKLMFHRRHVYEHNGGEADEKYIRDSGDTTVRLKQQLTNSVEDGHHLLSILTKFTRNLHEGFHELIPPQPDPIEAFQAKKERMRRYAAERS